MRTPIKAILDRAKYRLDLLRQAAIALGLLADNTMVAMLVRMLEDSNTMASQAAAAKALGFIGDRAAVEPLVSLPCDLECTLGVAIDLSRQPRGPDQGR